MGELLLSGLDEHEWAGNAAAREVLDGLGLRDRLDSRLSVMSGGERRRAALGALLIADAIDGIDLLMLDEPTNHLDVEGVDWLAGHLRGRRGALAGRHPRPLVPRRRLRDDVGGRRRHGRRL